MILKKKALPRNYRVCRRGKTARSSELQSVAFLNQRKIALSSGQKKMM